MTKKDYKLILLSDGQQLLVPHSPYEEISIALSDTRVTAEAFYMLDETEHQQKVDKIAQDKKKADTIKTNTSTMNIPLNTPGTI